MILLNNKEIKSKLTRIAYQIYEESIDDNDINIIGIKEGGFLLAKEISDLLCDLFGLSVKINFIEIDKKTYEIKHSDFLVEELTNRNIILIDDVLNTGKTIIYSMAYILKVNLKSLKIAVLIDRSYKKFPVKCDYKGLSIYTSLLDNIDVVFDKRGEINAYLN